MNGQIIRFPIERRVLQMSSLQRFDRPGRLIPFLAPAAETLELSARVPQAPANAPKFVF